MENLKRLKYTSLIMLFLSLMSLKGQAAETKNSFVNNKIELSRSFECRTITVGINLGIAYIETTLTICCQGFPPAPTACWEMGRGTNDSSGIYQIEYDIPKLWSKQTRSIEIVKSSIADFNGQKVRIKTGKYLILDNKVFLDYELI